MKNLPFFTALLLCLVVSSAQAQIVEEKNDDYRRSSLCLILIDDVDMPKRDTIVHAFLKTPIPEKYNDHNVSIRLFKNSNVKITSKDRSEYNIAVKAAAESFANGTSAPKQKKGGFGKFMKAAAGTTIAIATNTNATVMVDSKDKEEYAVLAYKHLLEKKVAKQLFDKWFFDKEGNFSMALVQQRGLYDASVLDIQTAKSSARGLAKLQDAGVDLINNTFVVVSRFRYISKDELVSELNATGQAIAMKVGNPLVGGAVDLASSGVKLALGEGYYVRTTSFLFQINWNEEVENTLYSMWDNRDEYDASDMFLLKYIGQESAFANVKASIFTSKTEGELIRIATINANDAVLAKLAKEYEVFRTKTPLMVDENGVITAYIGVKEGLGNGDKFEVLEQILDAETGKTSYKRVTTVKVARNKIWDNRFMADEELEAEGKKPQEYTATVFEGNAKGLYNGMLLKQIK